MTQQQIKQIEKLTGLKFKEGCTILKDFEKDGITLRINTVRLSISTHNQLPFEMVELPLKGLLTIPKIMGWV